MACQKLKFPLKEWPKWTGLAIQSECPVSPMTGVSKQISKQVHWINTKMIWRWWVHKLLLLNKITKTLLIIRTTTIVPLKFKPLTNKILLLPQSNSRIRTEFTTISKFLTLLPAQTTFRKRIVLWFRILGRLALGQPLLQCNSKLLSVQTLSLYKCLKECQLI